MLCDSLIRRVFVPGQVVGLSVMAIACGGEPEPVSKVLCDETTWYRDVDGDGAGDAAGAYLSCTAPEGHVADASDCDDQNASVFPGAPESCNGIDDDCDAQVDEDVEDATTEFYADADADGFGDPDAAVVACVAPSGHVDNAADCDDTSDAIHPDAEDLPRDGVDQDCDGTDATSLAEQVYVGDLSLFTAEDITAFCAEFDGVVGDLQLAGASLPSALDLSCLVEVTGDFVISTDTVSTLNLSRLWWVGADFRLAGNPALTGLDVAELRYVDGAVVILDNAALGAPSFPMLEAAGEVSSVDGAVFPALRSVLGNVGLASGVMLDALETVGGGVVIRDGALADVALPALQQAGPIDLRSVSVEALDLGALVSAESVELELPALSGTCALPMLEVVESELVVNTGATAVELEALVSVNGDVLVETDVLEVFRASSLASVSGSLQLGGAATTGLQVDGLESVDGAMQIACPGCMSLDHSRLATVGGDVSWALGPSVETLALDQLTMVGGAMQVTGADGLSAFEAPLLEVLGGECLLNDLPAVTVIDLGSLVDPADIVSIVNLPALETVDLSDLQLGSVGGHLMIRDNLLLSEISLGALDAAAGTITLEANPSLQEVDVSTLRTVGSMVVAGPFTTFEPSALQSTTGDLNLALDSLSTPLDLSSLTQVGGDLALSGEVAQVDLSALQIVGGGVVLQSATLTALDLSGLEEVFTDLTLELNLVTDADLSALRVIGGSATFLRGAVLTALELPVLESVGSLTFESMPVLADLDVPALEEPQGNLEVVECDALDSMVGFASLTGVQGSLILTGNDALTSVSDLSGITAVGGDLLIQDNVALSTAAAEALVYDDIGLENIGGGVAVVGNAP